MVRRVALRRERLQPGGDVQMTWTFSCGTAAARGRAGRDRRRTAVSPGDQARGSTTCGAPISDTCTRICGFAATTCPARPRDRGGCATAQVADLPRSTASRRRSFVTVVAHRVPRGESIVGPRSRCPACEAQISAAYDNLPVVSWLLLRGRARCCGAAIPLHYPLTELTLGRSTRRPYLCSGATRRRSLWGSSSSPC